MSLIIDDIATLFDLLEAMGLRVPPLIANKPQAAADAYMLALDGLNPDDLSAAVAAFVRTGSDFWPSAPKLRSLVPSVAVANIDNSEEAWSIFWGMICGSPGSASLARSAAQGLPWVAGDADMDRRMKHAAQALGGPRKAGALLERDMGMHRASFRRAYQAVATEEDMTRKPKALPSQAAPNVLLFPAAGGDS